MKNNSKIYPDHWWFASFLHSFLIPYSLLQFRFVLWATASRSIYVFKVFFFSPVTARKFRAKTKNMPHRHQRNAWNYFGVRCCACLFNHKHHLFNARRVRLFKTSAARCRRRCRFVSCLARFISARCFFFFCIYGASFSFMFNRLS